MSLARELLLRSERDAVLDFLQECKVFWKEDKGKLDEWIVQVKNGEIPNFELNLFL